MNRKLWRQLATLSLSLVLCLSAATRLVAQGTPKTRAIKDISGRVVEIPYTVTRVADAWPANVGMVLMLGGADKLVGITQQAKNQPWLKKLYPKIVDVPVIVNATNDMNIESLISTRPDVILTSYVGGMPAWMDKAAAAQIPVVMMPGNTFEDMKTTIRMTAEVLGPDSVKVANEWVKYYDGNVKKIAAVTASIPMESRPRVLHTMRPNINTVDGVGGLVNDWITNSGGVNVAVEIKGNSGSATMEQIIKWDPEVIICGTEPNFENSQKMLTDPQWSGIKAVKNRRVFVNPTGVYLWDRHSGEGALQILWAAKLLYPGKFPDIDVKKETLFFFEKFFHYRLTESDYLSIINATKP